MENQENQENQENYEEIAISKKDMGDQAKFLKDNLEISAYFFKDEILIHDLMEG